MEGSTLSEDQTRLIFETETIGGGEGAKVNDVIETANYFRAVDYVIDKVLIPLSEEFIKCLHLILKQSTNDSYLSRLLSGDYKKRENIVGGNGLPGSRNRRQNARFTARIFLQKVSRFYGYRFLPR